MSNPFDQFDGANSSASNPFDQFDAPPANKKQNKGIAGDLVTDLKRGVEQLPSIVTGLADIPVAAITGKPLIGQAADTVGGITGFAPSKWARDAEAEYSPGRVEARRNVDQAWEDNKTPFADAAGGDFRGIGQIAKSYIQNPQQLVGSVVESLPSMVGGAKAGQFAAKTLGVIAPKTAGFVGEGAVMAGQQMDQLSQTDADPRTAAAASAATGITGGVLGALGGKVASKLGVIDPDVALAGGALRGVTDEAKDQTVKGIVKEGAKRVAGGAVSEGAFEELPQSVLEQVLSNLAQSKPWDDGVSRAAVEGTLAGALMGGAFNVMPPKQEKKADAPPAADTPEEKPMLALPAPTYTGTPGDQIIAADSERQAAIDKAQAESNAIWAARDEYERQQAEYRKRPMPTITNDPEPIQRRIDALMGINEARLQGFSRTNYEKALENAFAEQIGFVSGKDSQEIPFTMGDYLKSKVSAADIDRKSVAKQPATSGIADAPVIPVVGTLSAAANLAVQSGAHAAHVAQQQVAIQNSQAEASSTKPGKADTPTTGNREAAPQLGILAGIAAQAPSIAQSAPNTQPQGQGGMPATAQQGAPVVTSPARVENGQPGWREAATAEIQRRGVQISQAQQSNTDAIAPSAMVNPDAPAANSASVPALKASDSAKAPEIQNGDGVTNLPTEKRGIKTIDRWSAEELQGRLDRGNLSPGSEQRLRAELAKRQPVKQSAPQASPLTVGKTPNGAEPVTVRNGVVHVGDYPAIDYETEADITVPEGATPQQIADALRNGGALGSRKIFGLKADEQKPQEKPAVEDTVGWTRMTTVEREALVAKAGWTGKTRGINLGGAIVAKQAWGKMSEANRAKLVAASQIAVKKENPSAATVAEETAAPDQAPIKNQSGDATEMVDAELPPNFDPDIQYAKRQDGSFKTKGEYSPEEWAAYTKSVIDKKLSQPKTDTAPEAKQEQAKASSNKTDRRQIDATRDSLFMAIAKSGGMDTGELLSNGFDASDITYESTARVSKKSGALGKKPRRPLSMGFGLPLHKKGGMSFDGMLEVMKQYGYLPEDATKNDAIDAFRKELGGDHVLTPDAETLKAEADQAEYDAQMLAEQDRIDAELAAQELAESETGYDELNDDQQALADAYADLVFEEDAAQQPERVIAAGMRALGFTEDEINEQLTKDAEAAQAGRQAAEGRSQEGGAGRPGNRAQDEGARQGGQEAGLTLEGQTNAQAAEQFAQQQAGDPAEPTKEQADRERDAVPFSLSEQSQPKPQGVQAGLFTADGRVSSEAKPAENPDALDAAKIRSGYAHRSLGGLSDKVKMEQGWFDAAVKDFAEKVGKNAESVEQKALADKLLAEFKAEYKTRRYRVMDVGSSVVSSAVAGRNNFNSSQAGKRGSALDRAEQSFSDWQNDAIESGVRAIRNARSPEQVLAEQKAKDDKAARNKEKLHSLIGKLMAFKKGDDLQFGNYPVALVTMDREGYPSSVVVDATDLTDNKFDIAKMLFNGDKDALRSAVDEILAEQIEKQQPAQDEGESRQYNTMAEIDSAIEGIFDGSLSLDEYKSAFRGLIKNKDAILAELNKQTKDGLLGRLGPMMAYRLKTAKKSEIVDGSFEAIRNTFALRRSFGPNSYTMSAGALAKYEADKLAALTALVEETTADDLKAFSDEIANDRSARQQKIEAAQDPKTIEDFDNAVRLKKPEGMAAPVVEDSGAGNIVGKDSLLPADTAIYGMSTEGKSASEILKFIVSASRNPLNRQIAKLLLKTGIAPQMAVGTSDGWKFNAGNDKKYAAAYNPKANTVALFRPASAERHVLHELMHAATLKALNQKGLAAGQMKALFAHVEKVGRAQGLFYDKATGRGVYGMADIDEFVAEAFTNPKFQEALKKVSAPKTSGTLSTAWNWFVRIVRGILGLKQGQDNALSQALEIGVEVMREDMALRKSEGGASAYTERMAKDNLDPDDAEAMRVQKAIEGKSTIDVAQWISVSGSPSERMIAGKVLSRLKMLESAGVNLKFKVAHVGDSIPRSLLGARGITTYKFGKADPSVDVWINGADVTGKVGTSVRTVLHELVHAATMGAVRLGGLKVAAGSKLAADVADLYAVTNSIIGHFNRRVADSKAGKITLTDFEQQMFNSENNAFRDVHETLAWALTDVDAQSYLESIPYQSKSAWTSFVSAIRQFLGLSSSADTALSEVLRVSEAIMSDNINDMIAMSNITGTAMATQESSDQMILSDHHGSDAIRYATGPKQTDSAAFRKWFGDSKVVDANGDPLVVYHGTGATDISEFKVSTSGTYGGGIYLTPEIRGANDYAIYRGAPSSTVYPVYAAIKNPASGSEAAQVASWKGEENAREELIKRGYDGVVDMRSGEIVAFYPEQIKSAIGNNGDFDPNNQDIRYNVADEGWQDNALSQALDIGIGVMRENMRLNEGSADVRYNAAPGKINQTDTEAFKRWFGDSAVVDSDGKPLRVFHGTASDITAFDIGRSGESTGNTGFYGAGAYFSEDADYASGFSFWARRSDDQAPNVVPVYLSLKNPAYINITPRSQAASEKSRATAEKIISTMIARGTDQAVVDKLQGFVSENKFEPFMGTLYNALGGGTGTTALLKEAGFDGVTIYGGISGKEKLAEAVAFDPTQIKSAIGNNGDFDQSNPDIRYNVADEGWSVAEPSKMDDVIYALQDKQIDMKRVVQSIANAGKKIIDQFNPYLQEELFHGRAAKGVKDFLDFELRPLLKQMQEAKVDMGDFEEYLWNRHAEERNKQIAKINPDMPDGGSGIETAKARAYLAGLSAGQRKTFEALAAKVEAMNRESQRVLIESGLEKQSTIDAWNSAYQHYVPLQREDVDSGHVGTGKGFSVRGSSSKRAMGSGRQVVDIIANLTMQRERNIVRAEKNRVSNALLGLAVQNPNPDFWKVDQAPKERVVNNVAIYNVLDANGKKVADFTKMDEADRMARNIGGEVEQTWGDRVQERIEPGFTSRDNVLLTRINGDDHYVIFNERDERAMRMAMAMKNLDVDNLGRVLSIVGKATRYLASINTQYNPVFGVINLIRDAQGALINLSSTALAGEQKRVLGYTKDALVGIYRDIRAHRAGKKPSSNWAALFEEFQKEGGQTGYRDQYANAEARAEAIKAELEQFKDGKAKQFTRGLFGWLNDYNETMENAVRLAVYAVAKEKGMSKQQAASLAKNVTVNFNRKGQMATQVGALYAFFNASVQGTARIAETLFEQHGGDIKNVRLSKKGKQIVLGGIMLGSMQALLLAAAGYDDDEPPEFVRERNLILPVGDGKYLTLAMPLGLHVIPGIGRIATEFVLSGGKDPLKRIAAFGSMFADAFNPVGSAGWSLQTITPSVVDPFAALAENKDFTGKEIYREDFNKLSPTPGHARAKDVATIWSRFISEILNRATGGTEFKPGMFSPSPDSIDYLIAQAGGGVMREANKVAQTVGATATGEDLPLYKIPLVGRFVGDTAGQSGQSQKFYEAIKQINMHEAQYKGLIKDGRSTEAREYLAENPAVKLIMAGNHAELAVRKLRTMKRDLVENDADQAQIRAIDDRITATMKAFNERAKAAI